jgi:hypothetical protein
VLGLLFVAGSLLSLLRSRDSRPGTPRDALFLVGLVIVFILQVRYGLRLISRASDTGAARAIAILVVVCFLIGIARAWELIGGPSIGFTDEIGAILRTRRAQVRDEPSDSESGSYDR